MAVRLKILICLSALLLAVIGLAVGAARLADQQAESAARVSRSLTERMAPASELAGLAKDIRYHVVQVQQFLTDASATRELGDDEKAAAEHAAAFETDAARAAAVARATGDATRLERRWNSCGTRLSVWCAPRPPKSIVARTAASRLTCQAGWSLTAGAKTLSTSKISRNTALT
jgi:hypothetical protein